MKKQSFWNVLKTKRIIIPMIQRDYAQGRVGYEIVRQRFLKSVEEALNNKEKPMFMDFVFGAEKSDKLTPLDGQQRLTTLWLVHWFLAYKTHELDTYGNTLKRFSYETRTAAKEFCEHLCGLKYQDKNDNTELVEYIKSQPWFYSAYLQDPTVQAMLTTLSGTWNNNKKTWAESKEYWNEDGIEQIFYNYSVKDLKKFWNKLTSTEAEGDPADTIGFYYYSLNDFNLSDDLYIKMNARGKALTNFENFKADLLSFVKEASLKTTKSEEKAMQDQRDFAALIDNKWTDIFWKKKHPNSDNIDDMFFAFINRFLLSDLMANQTDSQEVVRKRIASSKDIYGSLYNRELSYSSFDEYKKSFESTQTLKRLHCCLNNLSAFMDNIEDIQECCVPKWQDVKVYESTNEAKDDTLYFDFIPKIVEIINENGAKEYIINGIGLKPRIAFYAACCYIIENNSFNKEKFEEWMRFCWNLIELPGVHYSVDNMLAEVRMVNKLSKHSGNIREFLNTATIDDEVFSYRLTKEQISEEIIKSQKIYSDNSGEWKEKIYEAEGYAFFRGAIRFLIYDEFGNPSWNDFDAKFTAVKSLFSEKGIPEENNPKHWLRAYISLFDKWETHFWETVYDSEKSSWLYHFLNKELRAITCRFLLTKDTLTDLTSYSSCLQDEYQKYVQNLLVKNEDILSTAVIGSKLRYRSDWCSVPNESYCYALYPPNARQANNIILLHYRNEILTQNPEITFPSNNAKYSVCHGKDIIFYYKSCMFVWKVSNEIFICTDENNIYEGNSIIGSLPWKGECFSDFKEKLDKLISQNNKVSI